MVSQEKEIKGIKSKEEKIQLLLILLDIVVNLKILNLVTNYYKLLDLK